MGKQGIVNIHGKQYKTVALRVNEFRESFKEYAIETDLIQSSDPVIIKATIKDINSRVIATGYAEEIRNSTMINKTSALENCETSAIGRALACFGLAGEEYASADEVANAIQHQNTGTSYTKKDEEPNWYNSLNEQKGAMIKKIQSGEQTNQGIIDSLKKAGYAISKKTQNQIMELK